MRADSALLDLLAPAIAAPVECDGFVRLASIELVQAGVAFKTYIGRMERRGQPDRCISLHYWIVLDDGRLIGCSATHKYQPRCLCNTKGLFALGFMDCFLGGVLVLAIKQLQQLCDFAGRQTHRDHLSVIFGALFSGGLVIAQCVTQAA